MIKALWQEIFPISWEFWNPENGIWKFCWARDWGTIKIKVDPLHQCVCVDNQRCRVLTKGELFATKNKKSKMLPLKRVICCSWGNHLRSLTKYSKLQRVSPSSSSSRSFSLGSKRSIWIEVAVVLVCSPIIIVRNCNYSAFADIDYHSCDNIESNQRRAHNAAKQLFSQRNRRRWSKAILQKN